MSAPRTRLLAIAGVMLCLTGAASRAGEGSFVPGLEDARREIVLLTSPALAPYATDVGARFGAAARFPAPTLETLADEAIFERLCAGLGFAFADVALIARAPDQAEAALCRARGVSLKSEIVGYQTVVIVLGQDVPAFALSVKTLFLALGKDVPSGASEQMIPNAASDWSDADPALPEMRISAAIDASPLVREALSRLLLERGALSFRSLSDLKAKDEATFSRLAGAVRSDAAIVPLSGDIAAHLEAHPESIVITSLAAATKLQPAFRLASIEGIGPSYQTVSSGSYPGGTPVKAYVKSEHLGLVPGIESLVAGLAATTDAEYCGQPEAFSLVPAGNTQRR